MSSRSMSARQALFPGFAASLYPAPAVKLPRFKIPARWSVTESGSSFELMPSSAWLNFRK
ncbi:MAG: hypothetical protein PUI29_06115 [Aeromonadales bacterium]|nr:hypothetical protein [Aeromonadales bacterium]